MKQIHYEIKRTRRDWIVVTEFGHSHFFSKQGCEKLVQFCQNNTKPNNPYFIKAAQRILPPEQFENLRVIRNKQNYINGGYLK